MPIPENQVLELPKVKGKIDGLWCSFLKKFFNYDVLMSRIVKEHNIDVIFPFYLKAGKAKSIYWMPDFQFMHLPNFFTKQAVKSFNIKLHKYFKLADSIILSSEDAKNDFKCFSPDFLNKPECDLKSCSKMYISNLLMKFLSMKIPKNLFICQLIFTKTT